MRVGGTHLSRWGLHGERVAAATESATSSSGSRYGVGSMAPHARVAALCRGALCRTPNLPRAHAQLGH